MTALITPDVVAARAATAPPAPAQQGVVPRPRQPAQSGRLPLRRPHLAHRYDIAGIISVGSEVRLPELEYFRSPWLGQDLDIIVVRGRVGTGPHRHTTVSRAPDRGFSYEEHLGPLGANFSIRMGTPIEVTAGPLLARSPHVLYTNVIEALLRFVAVSRGRLLLHSACVEVAGRGMLISARTDTGKTGTILRLLREHGASFLSDDMTLLGPDGEATAFPKPLTISHHTLRAVDATGLTPWQWRRLRVQSRIHSKDGRAFAMRLAEANLPIMGVNALAQLVVPPPKYYAERLVTCRVIRRAWVEQAFVIERGAPRSAGVDPADALQELIDNTDDAYGFPPFDVVAPSFVIGEDDYDALRSRERDLLAAVLQRVPVTRLACDDFSWADSIATRMSRAATEPLPG
jgi:dolichol-phosphate mannosyltransferase